MSGALSRLSPLRFFGQPVHIELVNGKIRGGTLLTSDVGLGKLRPTTANPDRLGTHNGKDEQKTGQIYTHAAGFLDLGHVRNMADNTRQVFEAIVATNGRPGRIQTRHGEVVIARQLPKDRRLWADIALSAAYSDGLGYEIFTYGLRFFGKPAPLANFSSAFSPEDLTSNYLGARLAREALLSGKDYNLELTRLLNETLSSLGAVSAEETKSAIASLKGHWLRQTHGFSVFLRWNYLLRRDFERRPRTVGLPGDRAAPPWLTEPLPAVEHLYDYAHTLGVRIPRSEWPQRIEQIRTDAQSRYGDGYDAPVPVKSAA